MCMQLDFDEVTNLTPAQVYEHFRTPLHWPDLFPAFGAATERRDGWVRVPLRSSPFRLTAKISNSTPGELVCWDIKGFWRGRGEIHLEDLQDGTRITGYEKICAPRLLGWGGWWERWAQPRFAAVWESGWRRIRR